jgi:hypothetical protein
MRRYEKMSDDQIARALGEYRDTLRAIEKYQSYLASGNGLPRDELSRLQLQISNSKLAELISGYVRDLESELGHRAGGE